MATSDKRKFRAIKGAGGGSSGATTPVEASDSLRSMEIGMLVDAISEGPILGIINPNPSDPLGYRQSIYVNNTPLRNSDGTENFSNVNTQYRYGTQDQTPIDGISD